jgi:TolB-like protein/class 3 adenylate cyclase/Tfp pilus assembly protein PilF
VEDSPGDTKAFRKLAAILAADIAGYSTLMGADEEATVRDLKAHQAVILPMIGQHAGRVIDTAGDGILAEFGSVLNAVNCALAIQKTMADRNTTVDTERRMQFRIGINQGDVVADEARIYGDGINVAARLESIAEPGSICVSGKVYEEVCDRVDVSFEDMGEHSLKNIARPVRAYRILSKDRASANVQVLRQNTPAMPDRPSIAVLPFSVFSNESEQEHFGDGVVEDIITALSHFRWLFVIARNSSFAYKGRAVDVRQVSRELGVRYVLEGSVRKSGSRARIIAQLIDATNGVHISADRFDGDLCDIFALQEQVAASVAGVIAPRLERAEMERMRRRPTENLDAYGYFMRASAKFRENTHDANDEAQRLLYKAIELDPHFSSAYAQATYCYCFRKSFGPYDRWAANQEQEIAETARLARRAVELGRDDAFALCWAGFSFAYVVRELDDGAALLDRSLELNPNLARAWNLSGWVRIWLGEPEIAIEHLARAMRLSPLDPALYGMQNATGRAHYCAGNYAEAASWAERALRELPNSVDAIGIVAASKAMLGQMEEAQRAMARLRALAPDRRISVLRNVQAPFRRREDAMAMIEGLRMAGLPE